MSDTSQGPGWWLASDGKWYPPETWTGPPLPTGLPAASPMPQQTGAYQPYQQFQPYQPYPGSGPMPGYQTFQGVPMGATSATNGMSVASLVCSCAGIVPIFFGIPCVLGIIFGFVARSQIKRTNGTQAGSGLALAGIIVGFALIAIAIILIIVLAANNHNCTTYNYNTSCTGLN
jgi:hypothetical protein